MIFMIGEDFFYGKGEYLVVVVDLLVIGEILKVSEMEFYLCF